MLAQAIKRRLSKEENQKGFTLIELLAVIVILGIIAVIAIPLIGNVINNAKKDSDLATANQVYSAARLYIIGEKVSTAGTVSLTELQNKGYLESTIYLPSTKEPLSGATVNFDASGKLTDPTSGHAVILNTSTETKNYKAEEVLKSKPVPTTAPAAKE